METSGHPTWHYIWKCSYWWLLSICQISCLYQNVHNLKFWAMSPDYIWVMFVDGSCLVQRFFGGYGGFPPFWKTNFLKSSFNSTRGPANIWAPAEADNSDKQSCCISTSNIKTQQVFVMRKCCLWSSTADCTNTGIEKCSVSAEHSEKFLIHLWKGRSNLEQKFQTSSYKCIIFIWYFFHFFIKCRKMVENVWDLSKENHSSPNILDC